MSTARTLLAPALALALALASSVVAEESYSPEQRLRPRNFNHHPYDGQLLLDKYYKHLSDAEPTQQGPVLFPNDAPPPPKPPLIVTSRPLAESISRSELTPTPSPINNSLPQPSYLNRVRILRPNYGPLNYYKKPDLYNLEPTLSSYQDPDHYKPIGYDLDQYKSIENNLDPYKPINVPNYKQVNIPQYKNVELYKSPQSNYAPINFYKKQLIPVDTNVGKYSVDDTEDYSSYDEGKTSQIRHPYASLVKKSRLLGNEDEHRYNGYEEQTILPPIYKALSDYAQQKVLRTPSKPLPHIPAPQNPSYKKLKSSNSDYQDYSNELENETDYGKKYAFSYSVKDHKTGDDFSHSQHSSGSATNGEYRVRLPDGRMQIVSYTADEGGYKADVRYAEDDVKPVNNIIDNQPSRINQGTYPRYANDDTKPIHNIIDNHQNINQGAYPKNNYKQDYYNRYDSKEYYNDNYEYGNKISENENQRSYTPSPTKFGPIVVANNDYSSNSYKVTAPGVTATPRYDGTILITPTKKPFFFLQSTPNFITRIPVEVNVPSTTPLPNFSYGLENTERVVHIGGATKSPLLYTSVRNRLSHSDFSVPVTPSVSSYVSSTLSPLDTGNEQKSTLGNFVSRFSKYLSFNN